MSRRCLSAEQSNSSVVVGNSLVLKLIRKVASGGTGTGNERLPDRCRFHGNISPLLGSVVRRDAQGEDALLMIAQGYRAIRAMPGNGPEQPRTRPAR